MCRGDRDTTSLEADYQGYDHIGVESDMRDSPEVGTFIQREVADEGGGTEG